MIRVHFVYVLTTILPVYFVLSNYFIRKRLQNKTWGNYQKCTRLKFYLVCQLIWLTILGTKQQSESVSDLLDAHIVGVVHFVNSAIIFFPNSCQFFYFLLLQYFFLKLLRLQQCKILETVLCTKRKNQQNVPCMLIPGCFKMVLRKYYKT